MNTNIEEVVDTTEHHSNQRFFYGKQKLGDPVRNAFTGTYYDNISYGSRNEYLLWTVKTCGDFGVDKYYFDSPEQYEMANLVRMDNIVTVSNELKDQWRARRLKYMQSGTV